MNRKILALTGLSAIALVVFFTVRLQQRPSVPALMLYGDVDIREVDLAFRQSGRLNHMYAEEGDTVRPGQLLAALDPTPFQEALDLATANVAQAYAQLSELQHGNRPQEIAQAAQQVLQTAAVADSNRSEYNRQVALRAVDSTSARLLEAALANRDSSTAAWHAAQEHLGLLQAGARAETIAAAQAHWKAMQAAQAQAATALADTALYAPGEALVFSRVREPGSMVSPAEPVYVLSLQHPVYVRTYVRETDLAQMHPGRLVWVSHDGSTERYKGHIGYVSPRAEFTPKTVETTDLRTDLVYRLRITIDHPDSGLRQGMPVSIQLPPLPHTRS